MALIPKQEKKQRTHVQLRLGDDVLADLDRYCQFIDSARDYVVENILVFAFKKDRDFQDWLTSNPAGQGSAATPSPSSGDVAAAPVANTTARRRVANGPGTAGEAA